MELKFKRLHPAAILPSYKTDGAACFDICACLDWPVDLSPESNVIIPTGWAVEVPPRYALLLYSRSGLSLAGMRLGNCVGVIDSDYRGEIKVILYADEISPPVLRHHIDHGDRIAQGMLVSVPTVEIVTADDLSTTKRGSGGFGSTGTA